MRILALECSGWHGSAAVADNDQLIAEVVIPPPQRTAQGLAPVVAEALRRAGWQPADVRLVSVTAGPGSFTGLRVGIATAKAFAYATGAETLAVDTMAAVAEQVPTVSGAIHVVLDAQRRQLYAATFERDVAGRLRTVEPVAIVDEAKWLETLPPGALVTGPGLTRLQSRLCPEVRVVDAARWEPMASSVARLAWRLHQAGERGDVWNLLPRYYRPSAAEEKHPAGE